MMKQLTRILLVEDDQNDIELTLLALEEFHVANRIDVVRDGQEALDYLHREGQYKKRSIENPVVILLDVKMPKLDGIEVLEKIKSDKDLKDIPVVMLTSSDQENDIITSYKLGANAYVIKPIDFNEFIKSVKNTGIFWMLTNKAPSK